MSLGGSRSLMGAKAARWRIPVAIAVVVTAVPACSGGGSGTHSSGTTGLRSTGVAAPSSTEAVTSGSTAGPRGDGCPDVTGEPTVRRGTLRAGPFDTEALYPAASQRQAKMWVSSSRPGRDDAVVVVTDPNGRTTESVRKGGAAFVADAAQFWPGTFDVPVSGRYRIVIRVGAEELCVMARYTVTSST